MELGDVDGRAYGLLAFSYLTQENYYPAEAAYRQAILMQPETVDWKLGLARCLLEMGQYLIFLKTIKLMLILCLKECLVKLQVLVKQLFLVNQIYYHHQ